MAEFNVIIEKDVGQNKDPKKPRKHYIYKIEIFK